MRNAVYLFGFTSQLNFREFTNTKLDQEKRGRRVSTDPFGPKQKHNYSPTYLLILLEWKLSLLNIIKRYGYVADFGVTIDFCELCLLIWFDHRLSLRMPLTINVLDFTIHLFNLRPLESIAFCISNLYQFLFSSFSVSKKKPGIQAEGTRDNNVAWRIFVDHISIQTCWNFSISAKFSQEDEYGYFTNKLVSKFSRLWKYSLIIDLGRQKIEQNYP